MAAPGLSSSGKIFFGALCGGTFSLGLWQTARYFEKSQLIQEREDQLQQTPELCSLASNIDSSTYKRWLIRGKFLHEYEFLVGPRAPPHGVFDKRKTAMSSSPPGYFVVTPLLLSSKKADNTENTILVNRGWLPKDLVQRDPRRRARQEDDPPLLRWFRPTTVQQFEAVSTPFETPKSLLIARHDDIDKTPPRLYWFDRSVMQELSHSSSGKTPYVTMVGENSDIYRQFPLKASRVGDFHVTPEVHAGYALTWYSLAAAGLYMMRLMAKR